MASKLPEDTPRASVPSGSPVAGPGGMVGRIKALMLTPREEWARIDAEPMTVQGIMTGWAAPLAAIGPVATLIGMQLFGFRVFGIVYRPPIGSSLVTAVVGYLTALIGVYALALIIDNIAPQFGARRDKVQAMKAAAFSFTAAWLAGVFAIIPQLGVLGLLGLYSFYLLWVGLPIVMKPAPDKAVTYAAVSIACGIIAFLIISFIVAQVSAAFTPPVNSVGSISVG
jgi:hypothetical protein